MTWEAKCLLMTAHSGLQKQPRGTCISACPMLHQHLQLLSCLCKPSILHGQTDIYSASFECKTAIITHTKQACNSSQADTLPPAVMERTLKLPDSKVLGFQCQALLKKKLSISSDSSLLLHTGYLKFSLLVSMQSVIFAFFCTCLCWVSRHY